MPDKMLILFAFFALMLPEILMANTGVARGGEHDSFTRLTITTEQRIGDVQLRAVESGRFELRVSPAIDNLDASRLFDRLSENRVESLETAGGLINLQLNCPCIADVRADSDRLIVIDISEMDNESEIVFPVLPNVTATLPEQALQPFLQEHRPTAFDLDYSIVERLSKSIAIQMSETTHISGFSQIAAPPKGLGRWFEVEEQSEPVAASNETDDNCYWSRIVWNSIETTSPEELRDESSGQIGDPFALKNSGDAANVSIVKYLTTGAFDEAKDAFEATDPIVQETKGFTNFIMAVTGDGPVPWRRFGECDPLADLIFAASQQPHDVSNSEKLDTLHSFSRLPTGLQIVLFSRLSAHFPNTRDALFPELIAHLEAEKALSSRAVLDTAQTDADPDRLAAVSLELRNTEHEIESWNAAFLSFLDHRRYFDALAALKSENPLSPKDAEAAVSKFVDHATEYADGVTFVQLALTAIPGLDPSPSEPMMRRVANRLLAEGFLEEAAQIEARFQVDSGLLDESANQFDSVPIKPTGRAPNAEEIVPLPLATEVNTPDKVDVTVASAQNQLEATRAMRQALSELFDR
jgi:hypothetical protein